MVKPTMWLEIMSYTFQTELIVHVANDGQWEL